MSVGGEHDAVPEQLLAQRLLRAAVADQGLSDASALLQRLCRAAADGLSLAGGAIRLVGRDGESSVAAGSDPASTAFADLTFTAGEGPSIDAFTLRRPVLLGDLAQEARRWPGYSQLAVDMGVRAVISLPLQVGGMAVGVLDLYGREPRRYSDADFLLAVAFAQQATQALLGVSTPDGEDWDEPLLDHRAEIHQAQGMVMIDLGVDLAEALVRMRARAFSEGIPLIELARAILLGATLAADEEGCS